MWHRRYRLLVQLGVLLALGGIIAGIAIAVGVGGESDEDRIARAAAVRTPLLPILNASEPAPADLPATFESALGGYAFAVQLAAAELGAASAAADAPRFISYGWADQSGANVQFLSSGMILAEDAEQAEQAFAILMGADAAATLAYVEPVATSPRMTTVATGVEGAFGRRISYVREGSPETTTTVVWAVRDRALIFVGYNDFAQSPPRPAAVDVDGWLSDIIARYLAGPVGAAE